jgi:hypothetical protein
MIIRMEFNLNDKKEPSTNYVPFLND